jgi:hypothetical protein
MLCAGASPFFRGSRPRVVSQRGKFGHCRREFAELLCAPLPAVFAQALEF